MTCHATNHLYLHQLLKKTSYELLIGNKPNVSYLDMGGKSVDQKVYRSIVGSLFYRCASKPDIMLSVCMCVRF
jgi:hypothetical protein